MNTSAKKALLLHQQRERLYYKRSVKLFFCKTLIANAGINYTKKILEKKFITKLFVKSILRLESLNIIIIKKKKKTIEETD